MFFTIKTGIIQRYDNDEYAYEEAFHNLFKALDRVEDMLEGH